MKPFVHLREPGGEHIRLCGNTTGGSISIQHYRAQPEHVKSLYICKGCEMHLAKADGKLGE